MDKDKNAAVGTEIKIAASFILTAALTVTGAVLSVKSNYKIQAKQIHSTVNMHMLGEKTKGLMSNYALAIDEFNQKKSASDSGSKNIGDHFDISDQEKAALDASAAQEIPTVEVTTMDEERKKQLEEDVAAGEKRRQELNSDFFILGRADGNRFEVKPCVAFEEGDRFCFQRKVKARTPYNWAIFVDDGSPVEMWCSKKELTEDMLTPGSAAAALDGREIKCRHYTFKE